jgi:hypothetical protein
MLQNMQGDVLRNMQLHVLRRSGFACAGVFLDLKVDFDALHQVLELQPHQVGQVEEVIFSLIGSDEPERLGRDDAFDDAC